MNYTTFDITNGKMFKMTKGRKWIAEELTCFLTMAANQRCERRTSLSLRFFSVYVVCAKHRASWPTAGRQWPLGHALPSSLFPFPFSFHFLFSFFI